MPDDEAIHLWSCAQSREPVERLDRHGPLSGPRDDKGLNASGVGRTGPVRRDFPVSCIR